MCLQRDYGGGGEKGGFAPCNAFDVSLFRGVQRGGGGSLRAVPLLSCVLGVFELLLLLLLLLLLMLLLLVLCCFSLMRCSFRSGASLRWPENGPRSQNISARPGVF